MKTKRYCSTAGFMISSLMRNSASPAQFLLLCQFSRQSPQCLMFDGSSHFVLYQPDMGGAWLLFPPKLAPHRWLNNKEEKKVLGEKQEKNKRNGRHQPPQTRFFVGKKHPVNKTSAIFFFNVKFFWAVGSFSLFQSGNLG